MATRNVRGSLPEYGYQAASALMRRGVVLVQGASNKLAVIATAIGQGKWRGIQIDEGALPDGSANYGLDAAHPAEMVAAQKAGIPWCLAPANTSPVIGQQVIANAAGKVIARTPYSFSAFMIGQFDESATIGSSDAFVAVELLPQYVETVRQITVSQPLKTTVLGAATVFGATTGTAFGTAAIQLYRARFTGEKIRNLSVSLGVAPAGADTVIVTIQTSTDNGNTWATPAAAPTATVAGAAFSATDLVNAYTLTAGEIVAFKAVSTAGTAAGAVITADIT